MDVHVCTKATRKSFTPALFTTAPRWKQRSVCPCGKGASRCPSYRGTVLTSSHTEESRTLGVTWKKPDSRVHLRYGSVYIQFQKGQDTSMGTDVGRGGTGMGREASWAGTPWSSRRGHLAKAHGAQRVLLVCVLFRMGVLLPSKFT